MFEPDISDWLTCEQFAQLAGLPSRTARHVVARASVGKPVRDWQIAVRPCHGRGGRSGRRFEVALSSLSEALQSAWWIAKGAPVEQHPQSLRVHGRGISADLGHYVHGPAPVVGCGYKPAANQSARRERLYRIIQESLDAPRGSAERKVEVLRASKKWDVPERTIYRWIRNHEAAGGDIDSFARKLPSDAGKRRVWVSKKFDTEWIAAGLNAADLPAIGDEIDHLLARAWASPAERAGWRQVGRDALALFRRDLAGRGIELPLSAFYLSQCRIGERSDFRRLDVRENDRKTWDDAKPRIRRDASGLVPMESVVMDVKPLDCIVRRADGTTAWPKMIAFMDWGTHRVFRYFVLLAQGEGVRQEHVIDAFKAMVADPDWGFPQQLYRDNGTEFAVFDKIKSALELIKSKFATLDRFVFSQMLGWAGSNRMNKKTQTVGKPPAPYLGSFGDFVREADQRIAVFETYPINSGFFAGKSPAEWYDAKVAAGWRPVRVNPLALEAAFAKRETRTVDRGAIRIGGQLYRHPELPNGRTVTVALPYQRGSTPMVELPGLGWALLQSDMPYLPGDIAGAVASARAQQRNDREARSQRRTLAPIAPTEALAANVVNLPTRASPAPLIDLDMSEQARSFAGARIEAAEREAAAPTAAELKQRRIEAENRRLERKYGPF